ncbi:hypothetical protein SDC9_63115 [bioreactor metagenome]|uniref:Uncharacterized protein n=1 Tax=bioreactor metagenome TaxID=1076179 RepID=A0A644XRI7_9ZZZZ
MWDALIVRNIPTKPIVKKLAVVLFVMAITLIVIGCAPKPVEVIDSPTTPITDVNKEPTTPSKPTPETPTATPVETKATIEELFDTIPNVEGLTKKITNEQVVYLADSDNPYNLESGVYAGFYKENVEVEGAKTGGLCLLPEVVLNLVKKDTSKVVIPVAIENNEENAPLYVSNINKRDNNIDFLYVTSNSLMKIVGSCPTDELMPYYATTYKERKDLYSKVAGDVSFNALWVIHQYIFENEITTDTKSFFQNYYLSECNMVLGSGINSNFGEILLTDQGVDVTCKDMLLYTGDDNSFISSTVKDLLMVDDKPVFINTIQSRTE